MRCQECEELLASHPDPRVRRMLAAETGLLVELVRRMTTDPDILVASLAEERLTHAPSGGRP